MKQPRSGQSGKGMLVTPFVGVWIETHTTDAEKAAAKVTPFVGVWIETLKENGGIFEHGVTPFVGVWIETYYDSDL